MSDDLPYPPELVAWLQSIYDRALGDDLDPVWDEDGRGFTMDCPHGGIDGHEPHREHIRPVLTVIQMIPLPPGVLGDPPNATGPAG